MRRGVRAAAGGIVLLAAASAALARSRDPRFLLRLPATVYGEPAVQRPAKPASSLAKWREETGGLVPAESPQTEAPPVSTVPRRHFGAAAGEVVLLEVLPWAVDRYVSKEDFAYISFDTIKKNFQTGFKYDNDDFQINQSSHPYHGSLFFNAARANGYGYWESAAFTLAGSLIWECCMENTAPSINDLVNTTMGGATRGEIAHRLATVIRDNTAEGVGRVWREAAGAILDPAGAFTRLVRGEMTRPGENPEDRYPSGFAVSADAGYRRVRGAGLAPDQAVLSLSAYYGDPFAGDIVHPFDSFWAGMDLNTPGKPSVTRIEERGILKGWEVTDPEDRARHIVGFSQEYEYFNNAAQVVGAEMLGAGILSRYRLFGRLEAITDAGFLGIPLAGIQTTDFASPETGRTYDYAVAGGARAAFRVLLAGRALADAGYGVIWARTVNGVSEGNTLQYFRGNARIPIAGPVGVGGGYSWYSRKTTYSRFFEARQTQSEWRIFLDFAYGHRTGATAAR
jgi:hypothetical protein